MLDGPSYWDWTLGDQYWNVYCDVNLQAWNATQSISLMAANIHISTNSQLKRYVALKRNMCPQSLIHIIHVAGAHTMY
jgi:hypothetical protein